MNLRYRNWKVPLGQRKKGREESLAYMHTHCSSQQLCLHTQFHVMSASSLWVWLRIYTSLSSPFFGVRSRTTFSRIQKAQIEEERASRRSCVEFVISCEGKSGDGESTTNAQKRNRAFEINIVGWMKRKKIFVSVSFLVFISSTKHGAEEDMQESWGIACGLNITYYCWKAIG